MNPFSTENPFCESNIRFAYSQQKCPHPDQER
jgi:hypothetical protein